MATRASAAARRASLALATSAASLALAAGPASASPGTGSITTGDGSVIYKVAPDADATVIAKIRGSDRTGLATLRLRGQFELPAIANESSGLSHDGRTLVLGDHPTAATTTFALVDTGRMDVRRMLSLRGDYSFDAMSPDGSTLYAIKFLSSDGTHYAVQALDMTATDPAPQTVVEKGSPGEKMSGLPISRSTSPDGGWIYTLYDGAGKTPFVHALSTADKYTMCIDLDLLAGRPDLSSMTTTLNPETKSLSIHASGKPVAIVNTESFEVTAPRAAQVGARAPKSAPATAAGGPPTALLATLGALALIALATAATRVRTRRRPSQDLSH